MALHVDNLSVRRGDRSILEGFSLRVDPGVATVLTGPNGAGKTTLLRAIAGLLPVSQGTIRLEGVKNGGGGPVGEHCHFVAHLNGIKPTLTVAENAEFWADYLGGGPETVMPALRHFRMAELAPVQAAYLSAGQKRRLGLCRLLLAPRAVWLMDEPAVSLDELSRRLLAEVANRHLAEGGLIVAATHQPLGFEPAREVKLGRLSNRAGLAGAVDA